MLGAIVASGCARPEQPAQPAANQDRLTAATANQVPWANTVWQVSAPTNRAPGSIYVFLADGTLLMTSCVETYRLASWRPIDARTITIEEDRATRYDGEIASGAEGGLHMRLKLVSETVELTLARAAVPTVCPDLPR